MSTHNGGVLMWHGHRGRADWEIPVRTVRSNIPIRADQHNETESDEFCDGPDVLSGKVALLADLVRQSKFCVVYSGAGISRSSGIPDYASKTVVEAPKLRSSLEARPTVAHWAVAAMEKRGYVHGWTQQNHDGLPQKAGFPQEKMNEIHGAWYDPSNPVVQFSESLRGDLFDWMLRVEAKTDLCLCLGTSLSGMNADRVAVTPARKSLKGRALGTVIVNLQRTRLDDSACLRIWADIDEVFFMLAKELAIDISADPPRTAPLRVASVVPYGKDGRIVPATAKKLMRLDLNLGQRLRVAIPESSKAGEIVKVTQHYADGSIGLRYQNGKGAHCVLGNWWIRGAINGTVQRLPIVNVDPIFLWRACPFVDPTATTAPHSVRIIQSHKTASGMNESNCHHWSLQLDTEGSTVVDEVEWELHPTFRPQKVTTSKPPFRIERYGWGTFAVRARIKLLDEHGGSYASATHHLSFSEEGSCVKETAVEVLFAWLRT